MHCDFERVSLEPKKNMWMFESFARAFSGHIARLAFNRSSALLRHDDLPPAELWPAKLSIKAVVRNLPGLMLR